MNQTDSPAPPAEPAPGTESEAPILSRIELILKTPAGEPKARAERQSGIVLLVDLAKAVAWPVLIMVLVIVFFAPIRKTLNLVPMKIESASKASIGSMSWEIERQALRQGGPELAQRVGRLSPAAIEELINTQRDTQVQLASDERMLISLPNNDRLIALRELREAGLISFEEPLEGFVDFMTTLPLADQPSVNARRRVLRSVVPLSPQQLTRLGKETYGLTPKGVLAIESILRALAEQLQASRM